MLWDGIKVSDHGRSELSNPLQRIGSDERMADGTLRRQTIAFKNSWSVSWSMLPSINGTSISVPTGIKTVDGGMSGKELLSFYETHPGDFRIVLRAGSANDITVPNPSNTVLPYEDANFYISRAMITEFSYDVIKRGVVDFWNVSVSLEEV